LGDRSEDAVGCGAGVLRTGDVLEQDGELVATEACGYVGLAKAAAEPVSKRLEQFVAWASGYSRRIGSKWSAKKLSHQGRLSHRPSPRIASAVFSAAGSK
jgi:hypothetical protein